MKKKYVIIGCGRISYKHVKAIFDNYETSELVGVVDIVEKKAVAKASEYQELIKEAYGEIVNVAVFTDYHEAVKKLDFDIAAIATESGYHYEHTMDMLTANKHVIVEKPMALNIEHCEEMIDLACKRNLKLAVSHQNRFNPPIRKLHQAVKEGRFGRIFAANARILWTRDENYYIQAPWRGTYAMDGGCLMNQCIHNIDLLQWLIGSEPIKVNAMLDNYCHDYIEAEDYGSIQVRFANGAIGNIEGTVSVYPKNLKETLTILGEKGTVEIGGLAVNEIEVWQFADESDTLEDVKRATKSDIDNVYGNGHTPLFADFYEAVVCDRKPFISGEDGKVSVQIILNAYEQRG